MLHWLLLRCVVARGDDLLGSLRDMLRKLHTARFKNVASAQQCHAKNNEESRGTEGAVRGRDHLELYALDTQTSRACAGVRVTPKG